MFYLIGNMILREQIKAYNKDTKVRMDINHDRDKLNHMNELVLSQTCNEHNIMLTEKLRAHPRYLLAKEKNDKIMKATNISAAVVSDR